MRSVVEFSYTLRLRSELHPESESEVYKARNGGAF